MSPLVIPSAPFLALWSDPPTIPAFHSAEHLLQVKVDGGRGRGAYGNLDVPVLNQYMVDLAAGGYIVSTNITPKVGQSAATSPSGLEERVGIPYKRVYIDHAYDAFLTTQANILKSVARYALPANGGRNVICELHSEAEIQHGAPGEPDAQPYVGPSTQFKPWFRYIVNFMKALGVTNVWWTMSLTQPTFVKGDAGLWYPGPLCDIVGVDGYSKPKSRGTHRTPLDIAGDALTFASSKGRKLAVTETGCQEDPADPLYKHRWFLEWSDFSIANAANLWGMVLNHSDDGEHGWRLDTSASALSGARYLATHPPYSLAVAA